jgi:anti-sigma B factor antagonist
VSIKRGIPLANETIAATGGLEINVERGINGALVRVHGHINIDTSPALRERLLALLQSEPPEAVIVDLAEAPYIDLSGIATLIEAFKIARNRKTTLRLQGLHDYLLHFLELTGLLPLFEGAAPVTGASVSKVI